MIVNIEVSGRHVHLSKDDLEKLFGKNYKLTNIKNLSQPGEFACEEKVILKNKNKEISARIVGPIRKQTQVEISKTDAGNLGIDPPRNLSGDFSQSSGIVLSGPRGEVDLKTGVILAKAHIHCDEKSAQKYNLKNNQTVEVKYNNYIFKAVAVRVHKNFSFAMHIDTDEAIASGIKRGDKAIGNIID